MAEKICTNSNQGSGHGQREFVGRGDLRNFRMDREEAIKEQGTGSGLSYVESHGKNC